MPDRNRAVRLMEHIVEDRRGRRRGISAPGNYVDVTADMDVLFVISNCPQVNNPCNGFNPTPIRVMIWDPREA